MGSKRLPSGQHRAADTLVLMRNPVTIDVERPLQTFDAGRRSAARTKGEFAAIAPMSASTHRYPINGDGPKSCNGKSLHKAAAPEDQGERSAAKENGTKTECLDVCLDVQIVVKASLAKSLKLNGGEYRNRTGVHGFAIQCILPQKQTLRAKKVSGHLANKKRT